MMHEQGQVLQARDHWNDKRGWNKLHGGWGKRAEQPEESRSVPALVSPAKSPVSKKEWSNLRGAWGKRELLTPEQGSNPSPSVLSYKQLLLTFPFLMKWRSVSSFITQPPIDHLGREWSRKRESGWNNLKGLWGWSYWPIHDRRESLSFSLSLSLSLSPSLSICFSLSATHKSPSPPPTTQQPKIPYSLLI